MLHRRMLLTTAAIVAMTFGCSKREPRGDVCGEVICDRQPVQVGMVSFESVTTVAPPRNIPIQNGKYHADGVNALPLGEYRVRITAPKPLPAGTNVVSGPHEYAMYVPLLAAPWNTLSKLSVDVKPGKNTFLFHGKNAEEPTVEIGAE